MRSTNEQIKNDVVHIRKYIFDNDWRHLPDLVPSSPSSPRKSRDIAELDGTEERSQIPSLIRRSFIS